MELRRRCAEVTGRVQGVGFRPHVHRLATALALRGSVCNDAGGAAIDIEGEADAVEAFATRLTTTPLPPLARIDGIRWTDEEPVGADGFSISDAPGRGFGTGVDGLADVAPCPTCTTEFDDPSDRRFRYPFTCCTDCGPRLTIATATPWSRTGTVMAGYQMCDACTAEYVTPSERRFHAEAIACPACGPVLVCEEATGRVEGHEALDRLAEVVGAGGVAVVKGIGGHHLVGLADRADTVAAIRAIKGRDAKPMAVLVADLDAAHCLVELDDAAASALTAVSRPVVLARGRRPDAVAEGLLAAGGMVGGCSDLGVTLPSSLLHLDLARALGRPLVLTSANPSGAPTVVDDAEAAELADHPEVTCLVTHDRPVTHRADDTVVRSMRGRTLTIRSGRGEAVAVRPSPYPARRPVLGVGGHLKCTVSLAVDGHIHTSAHIGDLDHPAARGAWHDAVASLIRSVDARPELVVTDRHPDYASTWWGQELGLEVLAVQHHHAHAAAALVDALHVGPAVAVILDGHGRGDDGTSWGGEILVVDDLGAHRRGHLRAVALPGGAAAIREPWRMAVAWLAHDHDAARAVATSWGRDAGELLELCRWSVAAGATTTSVGRLIDAVAAIVGVAGTNRYEGDAAMRLEALASSGGGRDAPVLPVEVIDGFVDPAPMLERLVDGLRAGSAPAALASGALRGIAAGFARAAIATARDAGVDHVALSGGVLQNRIIDATLREHLVRAGLSPIGHGAVPVNDGGLSVGQAMLGARHG